MRAGAKAAGGLLLVVRWRRTIAAVYRDITTILANEKVNVLGVASRSDTRQALATIDMTIEIYKPAGAGPGARKLNRVPDELTMLPVSAFTCPADI